jgi:hypothetical protein
MHPGRGRPARALGVVLTSAAVVMASTGAAARPASPAAARQAVTVRGSALVDASGRPLRLLGVNRSGTEYACAQGWGIFDGPNTDASIRAMTSWRIDAVRLPLNEDCWLGINGVQSRYGGPAYRRAITAYVNRLHARGLYVILDLHVAAAGRTLSTDIVPMADADHAPSFWRSVAATFARDPAVVFDLYNEPHDVSWSCWRSGCVTHGYRAAGMQELVNAVRVTGARQPILVGGLGWASDLSQWNAWAPTDPRHQLAASLHTYDFAACHTSCRAAVLAVHAHVPVVTGELGESDCRHGYIDGFMSWADQHGISYLGWTWDAGGGWTCRGGPTLITAYDGRPTAFGAGLKQHLARLRR